MESSTAVIVDGLTAELSTTERVALVVYHVMSGGEPTTAEVAQMAAVTWDGAEKMLNRASRVVPITKYEGRWRKF